MLRRPFFYHRLPAILSIRPLKKTSLELIKPLKLFIWLVVWNIFIFPSSLECHPPNWRTHIFQRGRSTTNQKQQSFSRPIGVFFWFAWIPGFLGARLDGSPRDLLPRPATSGARGWVPTAIPRASRMSRSWWRQGRQGRQMELIFMLNTDIWLTNIWYLMTTGIYWMWINWWLDHRGRCVSKFTFGAAEDRRCGEG